MGHYSPDGQSLGVPSSNSPKEDGYLRMGIDYRKVNAITLENIYPIPMVDKTLDALGKARFITTLDVSREYYQVPVNTEDQDKTVFKTSMGKFCFKRASFS